MQNKDTLLERDGWLFVVSESPYYDKPEITRAWYPLGVRARDLARNYGEGKIGQALKYLGAGTYEDRDGLRYRLREGGDTKSEYFETIPIPCPRVRCGIETRYHRGGWEKYLKREGWISAY